MLQVNVGELSSFLAGILKLQRPPDEYIAFWVCGNLPSGDGDIGQPIYGEAGGQAWRRSEIGGASEPVVN